MQGDSKASRTTSDKIMKRTDEIFDECEVIVMEHMAEARVGRD